MDRDKYEYLFLRRLNELDADLADRTKNSTIALTAMLTKNTAAYPDFTDHTMLHSVNVQAFADKLIREHVEELSAEELYCFLMATSTHDIGMGVNKSDIEEFSEKTGIGQYIKSNPDCSMKDTVRRFHNDISACMVMKYYEIFDIPDETYAKAIALIGQGHRKMNLFDEETYPIDYELSNGARIRLPLLAAILRIADEVDMAADRNSSILYGDYFDVKRSENEYFHMKKHESIKSIEITDESIAISAVDDYPRVKTFIIECVEDLFKKLEYGHRVMKKYDTMLMNQKEIIFDYAGDVTVYSVEK